MPVDINPSAVAPSNGRRNTYILVAGVVIGGILTVIVVMVVCYIRKRGKSPPPAEECQTEESSCQEEVDLMEANLSLQTKVAQGQCQVLTSKQSYISNSIHWCRLPQQTGMVCLAVDNIV